MKKLIIWDFDGVISDTERLWVTSRMNLLNRDYNLKWNFDTAAKYMGGRSDKDKKNVLANMGICVSDDLWEEAFKNDINRIAQGLDLTDGIEDIFQLKEFDQCIATGGIMRKTAEKIKAVGIEKYFPMEKVFTVDLVKYGKPEPDLFLLAAETMGYDPKDCWVIEDSFAGLTAAIKAKMNPIAFIKYNTPAYIEEIKKLDLEAVFDNMTDVKNFILSH